MRGARRYAPVAGSHEQAECPTTACKVLCALIVGTSDADDNVRRRAACNKAIEATWRWRVCASASGFHITQSINQAKSVVWVVLKTGRLNGTASHQPHGAQQLRVHSVRSHKLRCARHTCSVCHNRHLPRTWLRVCGTVSAQPQGCESDSTTARPATVHSTVPPAHTGQQWHLLPLRATQW